MMITISLVNILHLYRYKMKEIGKKVFLFLDMRVLWIYSLNNFSYITFSVVNYLCHAGPLISRSYSSYNWKLIHY